MLSVTSRAELALQWTGGALVFVRSISREEAVREIEQYEARWGRAWDLDERPGVTDRLADVCIVVTEAPVAYRLEIAPPLD